MSYAQRTNVGGECFQDVQLAFDGGATYVIGGAPQLRGAEVETVRGRLFRELPD